MTGLIVHGFNRVTDGVNWVADYVPAQVSAPIDFLAQKLPAEGLKTFVAKPLHLVKQTRSYLEQQTKFPIPERLVEDISRTKSLISGLGIITNLPAMIKALSSPVLEPEKSRKYVVVKSDVMIKVGERLLKNGLEKLKDKSVETIQGMSKKLLGKSEESEPNSPEVSTKSNVPKKIIYKMKDGPQLSGVALVSSRIINVANWFISVADAINFVKIYRPVPSLADKATPWIYTVAGGYMALQGLYTELRYNKETWQDKDIATAEKYYGCLNIVTSIAYLFSSTMSGLAIYFKNQRPAWFDKYQFAANVGIVLFPIAKSCAEEYMTRMVKASKS